MVKTGQKAFTLIELLIVIALLGALAVGLLAALDPFEQLKKGTDTGTRNTVSEVHGAVIRYFAIKNNMPWCPTGIGCPADPSATDLQTAPMITALDNVIDTGELKADFRALATKELTKIFVTGSQIESTVSVCFRPVSKSFRSDPNTKFDIYGVEITDGSCPDPTGANACYWCVK